MVVGKFSKKFILVNRLGQVVYHRAQKPLWFFQKGYMPESNDIERLRAEKDALESQLSSCKAAGKAALQASTAQIILLQKELVYLRLIINCI